MRPNGRKQYAGNYSKHGDRPPLRILMSCVNYTSQSPGCGYADWTLKTNAAMLFNLTFLDISQAMGTYPSWTEHVQK